MITAQKHQREFLDWLADTYAVTPKLTGDRRHPRVEFTYQDKPRSFPISSSPSDPNADRVRRRHAESLLGPPPSPPQTQKRTLEELTYMAQIEAFRNPPRVLPAAPLTQPAATDPTYSGQVAQYKDRIRFNVPDRIAEHFGNSGVLARRLSADSWELVKTTSHKTAQIRYYEKDGYRFEIGLRTPPSAIFGASPAEFVIAGNQVLVTVKEKRPLIAKAKRTKPPTEASVAAVRQEMWPDREAAMINVDALAPVERMRTLLSEIRALEAQTNYRLRRIGDEKRWAWVAPTIE